MRIADCGLGIGPLDPPPRTTTRNRGTSSVFHVVSYARCLRPPSPTRPSKARYSGSPNNPQSAIEMPDPDKLLTTLRRAATAFREP